MHYRVALRNKVKQVLEAIPALTGRCYINRARQLQQHELPAVCIYTRRATADRHIDQWRDKKTCSLDIELHVLGSDEKALIDAVDEMGLLVESALFKDQTLGGVCEDIEHKSDEIETDADNDAVMVHLRLSYEVTVVFDNPDSSPEFCIMGASWHMQDSQQEVDAEDWVAMGCDGGYGFNWDGHVAFDGLHFFS